jgi:hypothetical protein
VSVKNKVASVVERCAWRRCEAVVRAVRGREPGALPGS